MVSVAANSTLLLGDNVNVISALRSNPLGCFQPSVLRTLEPGARLGHGQKLRPERRRHLRGFVG